MSQDQTTCACIGGSTYGTADPAVRRCDLCGGIVPFNPPASQTTNPTWDRMAETVRAAFEEGVRIGATKGQPVSEDMKSFMWECSDACRNLPKSTS